MIEWERKGVERGRRKVSWKLTHAPRPTLCHFAQPAKDGEFLVRHAHIRLVRLHIRLRDRLQLRRRRRGQEIFQNRQGESVLRKRDKALQIRLRYPAYGIDVRGRAVVLGQVPAETLVDVRAAEDKEATAVAAAADGGKELCEEVCDDHAKTGLDVLEGEAFGFAAAVDDETGGEVGDEGEEVGEGCDDGVHVEVGVVGADVAGEGFGSGAGLFSGVDGAHLDGVLAALLLGGLQVTYKTCGEEPVAELLRCSRQPGGTFRLSADPTSVFNHLFVAVLDGL